MGTNTTRWLTAILGAWLVSWGLMFSAPVSTAASSPESATGAAQHALELALTAPLPNALGGADHESVLDDQDPPQADAPTLSAGENAPTLVAVNDIRHRRAALAAHRGHLASPSLVEPRFLRYSRLLN